MLLLPVCMTWVPDWVKWMCYFKSSLGFFIMIRFRVWNSARMLWAPSFEQHSRVFAVYTEVKIKTEYKNNEHMNTQISICLTPSPFVDRKSIWAMTIIFWLYLNSIMNCPTWKNYFHVDFLLHQTKPLAAKSVQFDM